MQRDLDPTVAAVLGDALQGRLTPSQARRLAQDCRKLAGAFTAVTPTERALTRDLVTAADTLDAQATEQGRRDRAADSAHGVLRATVPDRRYL